MNIVDHEVVWKLTSWVTFSSWKSHGTDRRRHPPLAWTWKSPGWTPEAKGCPTCVEEKRLFLPYMYIVRYICIYIYMCFFMFYLFTVHPYIIFYACASYIRMNACICRCSFFLSYDHIGDFHCIPLSTQFSSRLRSDWLVSWTATPKIEYDRSWFGFRKSPPCACTISISRTLENVQSLLTINLSQ